MNSVLLFQYGVKLVSLQVESFYDNIGRLCGKLCVDDKNIHVSLNQIVYKEIHETVVGVGFVSSMDFKNSNVIVKFFESVSPPTSEPTELKSVSKSIYSGNSEEEVGLQIYLKRSRNFCMGVACKTAPVQEKAKHAYCVIS